MKPSEWGSAGIWEGSADVPAPPNPFSMSSLKEKLGGMSGGGSKLDKHSLSAGNLLLRPLPGPATLRSRDPKVDPTASLKTPFFPARLRAWDISRPREMFAGRRHEPKEARRWEGRMDGRLAMS